MSLKVPAAENNIQQYVYTKENSTDAIEQLKLS